MKRFLLLAAAVFAALTVLSIFAPWWVYPGTHRWDLTFHAGNPTQCVFAGDTLQMRAGRFGGKGLSYRSADAGARALGRFRWRIVPQTDSFWLAQRYRGPIVSWRGDGTIDPSGLFTGTREGIVAVEVREGQGRATSLFVVLPPIELSVSPEQPSTRTGGYVSVEIDARFPDGTRPPWTDRPLLRHPPQSGISLVREPTTEGRPVAPWTAVLRVYREGPQPMTLTYHTRRLDFAATGIGPGDAGPDTAYEGSIRRSAGNRTLSPSQDSSLVPPHRWRAIAMGNRCLISR